MKQQKSYSVAAIASCAWLGASAVAQTGLFRIALPGKDVDPVYDGRRDSLLALPEKMEKRYAAIEIVD